MLRVLAAGAMLRVLAAGYRLRAMRLAARPTDPQDLDHARPAQARRAERPASRAPEHGVVVAATDGDREELLRPRQVAADAARQTHRATTGHRWRLYGTSYGPFADATRVQFLVHQLSGCIVELVEGFSVRDVGIERVLDLLDDGAVR